MSLDVTDPALLFGGTWDQIQGRFLLAASDEYEVGGIGGEATHKLTVAEMPSHSHSITKGSAIVGWDGVRNLNIGVNGGNCTNQSAIGNTGGGVAHNNMPPYLVVYMWRRVA